MKKYIIISITVVLPCLIVCQKPSSGNTPSDYSSEIERIIKEYGIQWVEIEKPFGKTKVTEQYDTRGHQFLYGENAFVIDSILIYMNTVENYHFSEQDKKIFIKLNDGATNYWRDNDEKKLKNLDDRWEEHYSSNGIDLLKHPLLGMTAPQFDAVTLSGKKFDLSSKKGKVVFLNFWYLRCTVCYQEMPDINQLKQEFPEVEFISIMPEKEGQIKERLIITENGAIKLPEPYNYYTDSLQYDIIADGQVIINEYRFAGYPINFFIGKDGRIRYVKRFAQWRIEHSRYLLRELLEQ